MSNAPVVFIDTETTGLDPDRHEVWEVALVEADGTDHTWLLPVDLGKADPIALNIGQYHDRWISLMDTYRGSFKRDLITSSSVFALEFAKLTRGKHLVGAVPSFDEERLRKILRANGECPMWHYHLVCVENLVAGSLGIEPPWKSDELSDRIGVNRNKFAKHTALGDALWAKAMYEAVYYESLNG